MYASGRVTSAVLIEKTEAAFTCPKRICRQKTPLVTARESHNNDYHDMVYATYDGQQSEDRAQLVVHCVIIIACEFKQEEKHREKMPPVQLKPV